MNESKRPLQKGSMNGYEWLVSTDTLHDITRVLQLCPKAVLGKYVAITSFDSGPLLLSPEEESAGWTSKAGIAYSPEIKRAEEVPLEYFSEFYVFNAPVNLGELGDAQGNVFGSEMQQGKVTTFVNFDFALHDPEYSDLANLFWQQLGWIKAESYLAENDYLTFVTTHHALFTELYEALQKLP